MTPVLIALASLAGRRWGQAVGGWLVGLPFTSGPVAFFLALDHGLGFAAAVASGSIVGAMAQAAFGLAYARSAWRVAWPLSVVAGTIAFAAAALVLAVVPLPLIGLLLAMIVTLVVALALMPRGGETIAPMNPPRWDLPARMVVSTTLVLLITGVAPALGPRLSGVLAAFPVYATTLAVFAHRHRPQAGVQVLRGLLLGLFGFGGFFFVLGTVIERLGLMLGFAAAIAVAFVVQGCSLALILGWRGGEARGGG
ncbi:MAG TPA: hypothetical protein VID04_06630 [Methylomirabilota bacterium]